MPTLYLAIAYFTLVIFYTLYIAAINLLYDWPTLPLWVKVASAPILIVMVLLDFTMQCTFFTIFFFDLPRELLVTRRLERYRTAAYVNTWRQKVATSICTQALNPFDPTRHHC